MSYITKCFIRIKYSFSNEDMFLEEYLDTV